MLLSDHSHPFEVDAVGVLFSLLLDKINPSYILPEWLILALLKFVLQFFYDPLFFFSCVRPGSGHV